MSAKRQIRCSKCQTLLQFNVSGNAAVLVKCVRCGTMLRVQPTENGEGPIEGLHSGAAAVDSANSAISDHSTSDPAWAEHFEAGPSLPPIVTSARNKKAGSSESDQKQNSILGVRPSNRRQIAWVTAILIIAVVAVVLVPQFLTPSAQDQQEVPENAVGPVPGNVAGAATDKVDCPAYILSSLYESFAINEADRQFAGMEKDGLALHIYSEKSLQNPKPEPEVISVPSGCRSMVFKPTGTSGYYCVLGLDGDIHLIDPSAKRPPQTVKVKTTPESRLLASHNPQDPWLFVLSISPTNGAVLTGIHTDSLQCVDNEYSDSTTRPQISHSGKYLTFGSHIFHRADVTKPPTDMRPVPFSPQSPPYSEFQFFFTHQDQFLSYGPTLIDVLSATETTVSPSSKAPPVVPPQCGFHDIPIMVSVVSDSPDAGSHVINPGDVLLGSVSSNTFSAYSKLVRLNFSTDEALDAPPPLAAEQPQESPPVDYLSKVPGAQNMLRGFRQSDAVRKVRLFPDDRNRRLFCLVGRELKILPAETFEGAQEPMHLFPSLDPGPHPPGQRIRIPLNSTKGLTNSIVEPLPKGAIINGGAFEWSPGGEHLGTHRLTILSHSESSLRTLSINLTVGMPTARLPAGCQQFIAGKFTGAFYGISSDQKQLLRCELPSGESTGSSVTTIAYSLPGSFLALLEKRLSKTYLCVLSEGVGGQRLSVLEAETLAKVHEFPVSADRIAASEDGRDSLLFYSSSFNSLTGAISLSSFADLGPQENIGTVSKIAPNGRLVFTAGPKVFLRVDEFSREKPEFHLVREDMKDWKIDENAVLDFESTLIAANRRVSYTALPGLSLEMTAPVIYMNNGQIVTTQFEEREIAFEIQDIVPGQPGRASRIPRQARSQNFVGSSDEWVTVDPDRQRVIVVDHGTVAVYPQSVLGIETEMQMQGILEFSAEFSAGQPESRTLRAVTAGDGIEVGVMPQGMTARGTTVTWEPSADQIGNHLLHYRVTRGTRVVDRQVFLHVLPDQKKPQRKGQARSAPKEKKPDANVQAPVRKQYGPIDRISISPAGTAALFTRDPARVELFRTEEVDEQLPENALAVCGLDAPAVAVMAKKLEDRNTFVILTRSESGASSILILEAENLKMIARFPLEKLEVVDLVVSHDSGDAWAFCCAKKPLRLKAAADLFAVNLLTGAVSAPIATTVSKVGITADGSCLLASGHPAKGEVTWFCRSDNVVTKTPELTKAWQGLDGNEAPVISHPFSPLMFHSQTVHGCAAFGHKATNDNLLSPAFLRDQAVLLGGLVDPTGFLTRSTSPGLVLQAFDQRSLTKVGTPVLISELKGETPEAVQAFANEANLQIVPDEERQRAICLVNGQIVSVSFRFPSQPALDFRLNAPRGLLTEMAYEIPVEWAVPDPNAKIIGSTLPAGMKLSDGRILWTPSAAQYGLSKIEMTASDGATDNTLAFLLKVVPGPLQIDIDWKQTQLSTSGDGLITVSTEGTRVLRLPIGESEVQPEPSATAELNEKVTTLACKQAGDKHYVLVGNASSPKLTILDAMTLKQVAEFDIGIGNAATVQVSKNPTDPFFYFVREGQVFAASLSTMQPAESAMLKAENFAIAPSGVHGYAGIRHAEGHLETKRVVLLNQLSDGAPRFSIREESVGMGPWVNNPIMDDYGRTSILDGIPRKAEELSSGINGQNFRSIQSKDYAIGMLNGGETILSLRKKQPPGSHDNGTVVELVAFSPPSPVPLGVVPLASDENADPFKIANPPLWRVLVDEAKRRVICLHGRDARIISFELLKMPLESRSVSGIWAGNGTAKVGEESLWRVYSSPANTLTFSLPKGAVRNENEIRWTPQEGQEGKHTFTVDISNTKSRLTLKLDVFVRGSEIEVPIPSRVAADKASSRVALWYQTNVNSVPAGNSPSHVIQTADLNTGGVSLPRPMLPPDHEGSVRQGIVIDDSLFFHVRTDEDSQSQLWRIRLDGLDPAEKIAIPEPFHTPIVSFSSLGKLLFAEFQNGVVAYDSTTLQVRLQTQLPAPWTPRPVLAETPYGQTVYGVVVDQELNPQLALRPAWHSSPLTNDLPGEVVEFQTTFEATPEVTTVIHGEETRIAVSLRTTEPPVLQVGFRTSSGQFVSHPVRISSVPSPKEVEAAQLCPRAHDVVLCVGTKMLPVPYPTQEEFQPSDKPTPLKIQPEPGHVLISATGTTMIGHRLQGESKGLQAVCKGLKADGLEFQPQNQIIIIDGPRLRRSLTALRATASIKTSTGSSMRPEQFADALLKKLHNERESVASEVLHYKGQGLLEAVPIVIDMVDSSQKIIARTSYCVYIDLNPVELRSQIIRQMQ